MTPKSSAKAFDQIPRGTLMAVISVSSAVIISIASFWVRDINERVRIVELDSTTVKAQQISVEARLVEMSKKLDEQNKKLDTILYKGLRISNAGGGDGDA